MSTETPEQAKARLADARADAKFVHELHHKALLGNVPVITNLGTEAIKTAILINGGTAAALLTFVGKERLIQQPNIVWALQCFAVGLMFGAAAAMLAYVTQFFYGTAHASMKYFTEHPYVRSTRGSRICEGFAIFTHMCCAGCVFAAYGYAVYAFYNAGLTLSALTLPPKP
ncbi:hypothetical protein [Methylobacterium soli]|uniref:Uncharacterized protein n=1 Tax=Methylobacterium soli TaxID=553447 RepID=A0A6L3SYY6_9HYPH|nr:hypothetical protein [Methylobacterium soli]KAB1079339.1 hypothetical protein F6X53_11055 [Methylobacterium soli]GJE41290.1 hypothetical protein AEGHOMDF_0452 [Methylobacterium soli]